MENTRLSEHFTLAECCNWKKYPANQPTMQQMVNMAYGCLMLLEPARKAIGCPIIVNSASHGDRPSVRSDNTNKGLLRITRSRPLNFLCCVYNYFAAFIVGIGKP